ncbi:type I restriction-modification system subunit M N-terminal domain-containing protein [Lachnospiraceae bacterium 48-21]
MKENGFCVILAVTNTIGGTIMTKQELAARIWATANELRKNIKASEYKDYILGFMFWVEPGKF